MTELPTTFGKYFLTEKLATGGMAEIYLAKLVGPGGFEKQLVIKQIHPKLSGQRHFVDLFVTEAKTLVTLSHGNIVPVYELGVIDDTYFIAMEYIDGPTLYRLTETLAKKSVKMEPALAAWITARILEGLDYAHRKGEGVIHRDLSPRNVMLSRDGNIKLVDFGIAIPLGASDDGSESAPTGSFPYMSPEQVRREALSGQTDLFSVGVLLWEMLVGERLFARKDPDETLEAVKTGDIPRPSSKRAEVPAKLDDVVMRALARDTDARWPDAGEMLAQLQRYLYALEEIPGPREVAALVARYCPPETRRIPTHADVVTPSGEPPAQGPRTAVIPRDGEVKGKTRARTETFATNVELEQIIAHATPMFGVDVIDPPSTKVAPAPEPARDEPEPASNPDPRTSQRSIPRAERSAIDLEPLYDESDGRPRALPVPGRTPPSRALLVVAALGTLLLGAAAVFVFLRGPARTTEPDAAIATADAIAPDAASEAPADAPLEAPAIDAPSDDAVVADARVAMSSDAGVRVRPDAALATIDAPPRATGTGIVKIGAAPWGEVIVDGIARGRTPLELTLSAGKHTVEIVFRGEDPPRSQKQTIDLATGKTEDVFADFTKP